MSSEFVKHFFKILIISDLYLVDYYFIFFFLYFKGFNLSVLVFRINVLLPLIVNLLSVIFEV